MEIPQGQQGHIESLSDKEGYSTTVPKDMYNEDYELADHAFRANRPDIGYQATVGRFNKIVEDTPYKESHPGNPEKEAARAVEIQGLVGEMQKRVEEMPLPAEAGNNVDNPLAAKWHDVLERMRGRNEWDKSKPR